MPRLARITFENAFYHILTRGNNKQNVFLRESDFVHYKSLLQYYKEKYNITIYHYILMRNHIHQIVKSSTGKQLSEMMKGLNLTYAQYFRKKYGGIGHFWQDRFKSFIIQDGIYLLECGRYIELNSVEAGVVEFPWEYEWSSCQCYIFGKKDKLIELNPEYLGISGNPEKCRETYKQFLINGTKIKEKRSEKRFFKVGVYGSKEFTDDLRAKGLKTVWSHSGQPKK